MKRPTKAQMQDSLRGADVVIARLRADLAAEQVKVFDLRAENQKLKNALSSSRSPKQQGKVVIVRAGKIEDAEAIALLRAENDRLKRELNAK